jgi:hypothetical protein
MIRAGGRAASVPPPNAAKRNPFFLGEVAGLSDTAEFYLANLRQ